MTIQTKYGIGQTVWVIEEISDKPKEPGERDIDFIKYYGPIEGIANPSARETVYGMVRWRCPCKQDFKESECYLTLDDLIREHPEYIDFNKKQVNSMEITKKVFDMIEAGEIFRTVTTRFQRFHEPYKMALKFVCVKGAIGIDWAIYAGKVEQADIEIKVSGDKVKSADIIRSICPCDQEVFDLYRY